MPEHTGGELLADDGEAPLIVGVVEGVGLALEERKVRVHAGALYAVERLWHERGVDAAIHGDLLHDQPKRHDVVRHAKCLGVAEVDLVLARRVLVERVLDRDAHRLKHVDRGLAQIARHVSGREIEIRGVVDRLGSTTLGLARFEVEELGFRSGEERVPLLPGGGEVALQDLSGIPLERGVIKALDVAEHPARRLVSFGPRQQFEGGGIGTGEDIGLVDSAKAVDGGAVELHTLVEHLLEFGRRDRH